MSAAATFGVGPDGRTCHCPRGGSCPTPGAHPKPFASYAAQHAAAGISPVPVRPGCKAPIETGWTGHDAPMASGADVAAWVESRPGHNIGDRLPPGTVAIDVDDYDGKVGARTFAALTAELGQLPAAPFVTSRGADSASRKLLFRTDLGDAQLVGSLGTDVDVLSHTYRYVLGPGSEHPDGSTVRAYAPDGSPLPDGHLPQTATWPILPGPWQRRLLKATRQAATPSSSASTSNSAASAPASAEDVEALQAEGWRQLDAALDVLDAVDELAEGERTEQGWSWEHPHVVGMAMRVRELAAAKWYRGDVSAAVDARKLAPVFLEYLRSKPAAAVQPRPAPVVLPDLFAGAEDRSSSAHAAGADGPRPTPAEGKTKRTGPSAGKGVDPVIELIGYAQRHFELGVTPDREPFAVPRSGPRRPVMLGETGNALAAQLRVMLLKENRTVPVEVMKAATATLSALARNESTHTTTLHLRVVRRGDEVIVDLGQPASAACVVVTAGGWRVEPAPPPGVLFRTTGATHALPTPVGGGDLDDLRDLLGLDGDAWLLAAGWLVASVLADVQRPLLAFLGAAGTGKTTRALCLISILDPRPELGSSFGRNADDDRVSALGRFLLGYDNLSSTSESVSDHMCRLVTGESSEKRQHYSDTGTVTMSYRRTGVFTAVALPLVKADALERIIAIRLEPMAAARRRSERAMRSRFAEQHPALLGALLTEVSGMLSRLPAVVAADEPGPRMLDFYQAVAAWLSPAAEAYLRACSDVMVDAAEGDPFVVTLRTWLRANGGSWAGEPADAHLQAAMHRAVLGPQGWWPQSPASFTRAVVAADAPLRAVGITAATRKSNGRRRLVLELSEVRSS